MLPAQRIQLKTIIVFALLLMIAAAPTGAEARGEYASNCRPVATYNFWLSPLTSHVFSFDCLKGDMLAGSFTVTVDGDHFIGDQKKYDLWVGWGDGVDLYIFDNQSYDAWLEGLSPASLYSKKDLTELSWKISIPHDGDWYVVYDNDSSIYGKQIEGTINHISQNSILMFGLLILGGGTFALLTVIFLHKKRQ